jgi:polyisoprenyl-phosphate glycosyltransferase
MDSSKAYLFPEIITVISSKEHSTTAFRSPGPDAAGIALSLTRAVAPACLEARRNLPLYAEDGTDLRDEEGGVDGLTKKVSSISVVVPVYKARDCLAELHRRLVRALEAITPEFEIVLVEDGGDDGSWDGIVALAQRDPRVKGFKLSRNFGQHYAITAGLDHASGDWVVVMDCDLQDQPEEIGRLYRKAQEGYDVVFARRQERKDTFFKRANSKLFSLLYSYLGDIKVDNSVANFSISTQSVISYVRKFRERNRSFPAFLHSVGFKRAYLEVEHASRFAGKTSYTLSKLFDFAIQCIVSQSNKPLRLSIRLGFALSGLSVAYAGWLVARYFIHSVAVEGWTSIMVLMSFLSGLLFANLGILGLYLGKVFDEVKDRPLYCIERTCNLDLEADTIPQRDANQRSGIFRERGLGQVQTEALPR